MLEKSFVFLERIGALYEQRLWQREICSWHDFLNAREIRGLSKHRKAYCDRKLREAMHFFYSFDSSYFIDKLPQNEMWRLYHSFSDETVFLDIETAGLSTTNPVTVVGLFDGINTKTMVKGINLDEKSLAKELQKYKLIVTFNGASFDLPFLRRHFPGLLPRVPHFDLKPACARIGLKGGLKAIEKQLGIKRGRIVDGMYGGDALCLWKMYRATGDDYYLQLLVEYNEEDVVNLKTIANHVTEELSRQIQEKYFRKEEPLTL